MSSGASAQARPPRSDLLFNAEDAGGEDRWGNADHGYLIGVFAPAAAGTLDQLQASALTVWIRIDRSSQKGPRLKLRWQDGLHLPTGDSEAEREQVADSLWQALPPRAGRQDVAARDLPRTLYGEHVRCVSFLSTSVRASVTPNLLAQPLNEISERRIFEAIAALTGIDHELEKERQARRHEYDRQQEASDAESELASWEESAQVIEDGIDARDRARGYRSRKRPGAGGRARHGCCAMRSSVTPTSRPRSAGSIPQIERDSRTAQELAGQAAELADDEAFTQRQQAAMSTFGRLDGDDRELGNQIATLEQQIEDADRLLRAARETARDADGRDEPTADRERADADIYPGRGGQGGRRDGAHARRRPGTPAGRGKRQGPGPAADRPPRSRGNQRHRPARRHRPQRPAEAASGSQLSGRTARRPSWTPTSSTGPACSWRAYPARS